MVMNELSNDSGSGVWGMHMNGRLTVQHWTNAHACVHVCVCVCVCNQLIIVCYIFFLLFISKLNSFHLL